MKWGWCTRNSLPALMWGFLHTSSLPPPRSLLGPVERGSVGAPGCPGTSSEAEVIPAEKGPTHHLTKQSAGMGSSKGSRQLRTQLDAHDSKCSSGTEVQQEAHLADLVPAESENASFDRDQKEERGGWGPGAPADVVHPCPPQMKVCEASLHQS